MMDVVSDTALVVGETNLRRRESRANPIGRRELQRYSDTVRRMTNNHCQLKHRSVENTRLERVRWSFNFSLAGLGN